MNIERAHNTSEATKFVSDPKHYATKSSVEIFEGPIDPVTNQPLNKSHIWVEEQDFCCAPDPVNESRSKRKKKPRWSDEDCLIIGFDTEFKTPDGPVPWEDVKAGKAKYQVLSYQFHCRLPDHTEWSGMCCPLADERMSLGQFLVFALGSAKSNGVTVPLPRNIYIVGHFTRADIPAFADFGEVSDLLANVRSTFISADAHIPIAIKPEDKEAFEVRIRIRDTILLAPASARSLAAVGELVGREKLVLDPDPAKERWMKKNMDVVRRDHWDLFKRYAMNDAIICVDFIERIRDMYQQVTGGPKKIPVTLTSIGVDLLLLRWGGDKDLRLEILGKEEITEKRWDKKRGYYVTYKRDVDLEEIHWSLDFVTGTYHGGRNEQFWFGPGFADHWTDYDLSSAYPTAMSLIGKPLWREFLISRDPSDFTPTTMGFACVDFEFPEQIRYPTLPVRTANGLIFPRRGRSMCASPEIVLARSLGADISIRHGVIVPTDNDNPIFGPFIKSCLEERANHPPKTFDNLLWKELTNSTYGKTAQGLREKRVYDMRERSTKPLPPSRITNPFFASFITSSVRAVLGEIMTALPDNVCVFSCTTDGFLSNASASEIELAQQGKLAETFKSARMMLTGKPTVLEKKHEIVQPLGWRTRGQATLLPGTPDPYDKSYHIVLAKAGIYTPPEIDTDDAENDEIVRMFRNRTPTDKVRVPAKTGIRDMIEYDADLVEKNIEKRLNMEFDWKRKPFAAIDSSWHKHIAYSTLPWGSVEEFKALKILWEEYQSCDPVCVKSVQQLKDFLRFAEAKLRTPLKKRSWMRRKGKLPLDISRLRLAICCAWGHSEAGLKYDPKRFSAEKMATLLVLSGIPCERHHVENGRRKTFQAHSCPATKECIKALDELAKTLPELDHSRILAFGGSAISLELAAPSDDLFVSRCSECSSHKIAA